MSARLTIDQEAYDISATVDDYFLKRADAPYCCQAQRKCGNSSNIVCPRLNIYSTKFGRDTEFRCESWARGGGRPLGGLDLFRSGSLGALFSKSMTSYERSPDYVALKPTWKGNLGWLFLIAMIVSASIFIFAAK